MAGGYSHNSTLKNQKFGKVLNNTEVFKESIDNYADSKVQKFSLRGVLGLNQSVEINRQNPHQEKQEHQLFSIFNHLEQEHQNLIAKNQEQLKQELESLRKEINNLIKSAGNLDKDVVKVVLSPTTEVDPYQLSFFNRIRNFIATFKENISEAAIWVQAFAAKKKKRNAFWSTVKNKKNGGEQYLFSNEHSAARSAS